MNKTLNHKSLLTAASLLIAVPLAAQTPAVSRSEPVLMAAAFVPNRTSTAAAKPIVDRPLSPETVKDEPISASAPLPKLSFPKAVSASAPSGTAVTSASIAQVPPAPEAPTSRRFGPVTVEPGTMSYATMMGTNIDALQRFGAAPGVTRLTFGR